MFNESQCLFLISLRLPSKRKKTFESTVSEGLVCTRYKMASTGGAEVEPDSNLDLSNC